MVATDNCVYVLHAQPLVLTSQYYLYWPRAIDIDGELSGVIHDDRRNSLPASNADTYTNVSSANSLVWLGADCRLRLEWFVKGLSARHYLQHVDGSDLCRIPVVPTPGPRRFTVSCANA